MAAATFILKRIIKKRVETYSDIYEALKKKDERVVSLLDLSLELLFILGLIEYHEKNDLIEYVGP
jgi:hypothetical protein